MRQTIPLLLIASQLTGQQSPAWDTLCFQKFSGNLILGVFQSYRNFSTEFSQSLSADTAGISGHHYSAESKLVTGIEVSYDKFSLAVGLQSKPQSSTGSRKNTTAFNAQFNAGGNKWASENMIRRFTGFYDLRTPRTDPTFEQHRAYNYQPGFTTTLLKSKVIYYSNHRRFSARSGYSCNYRQIRSAATWILSGNVSHTNIRNDSSFFMPHSRQFYGEHASMNGLRVIGMAINAGGGVSLVVWRAFFIQLMFIAGPEQQWRKYSYQEGARNISYLSLSSDFRASIGFNFRRWYFVSFSGNEFTLYNSSFVSLANRSVSGGLILGYRFNTKTPGFYQKFQKTRLYNSL